MELVLTLLQNYGTPSTSSSSSNNGDSNATTTPHNTLHTAKKRTSSLNLTPQSAKMEKDQWGLLQLAIGDSQRFLDLLNSLKWEDGLPIEAVNLIESKLATSHNSPVTPQGESHPSTADSASSSAERGTGGLITVSMAKHAAESVAFMCGFAVSIVEYQRTFEPYRAASEKVASLRQNLTGTLHCYTGIKIVRYYATMVCK